jgi:hypothetical protein
MLAAPEWEYTSVASTKHQELTEELRTLGREGWELVSVVPAGVLLIAFLKRPRAPMPII